MESDFRKMGFGDLITSYLGARSLTAVYSYSDIIKTIFYIHAIGGDVLDDVSTLLEQMKDHPDIAICSADTIEYVAQELKKPSQITVLDFVKPAMRLKNFILHFVTLTAKWIKKSRQQILQIFTSRDYSPLWASP